MNKTEMNQSQKRMNTINVFFDYPLYMHISGPAFFLSIRPHGMCQARRLLHLETVGAIRSTCGGMPCDWWQGS